MYDALKVDVEASAKLRDQMIAELNQVGSNEEAARWAKRRYPDKTTKLNAAGLPPVVVGLVVSTMSRASGVRLSQTALVEAARKKTAFCRESRSQRFGKK